MHLSALCLLSGFHTQRSSLVLEDMVSPPPPCQRPHDVSRQSSKAESILLSCIYTPVLFLLLLRLASAMYSMSFNVDNSSTFPESRREPNETKTKRKPNLPVCAMYRSGRMDSTRASSYMFIFAFLAVFTCCVRSCVLTSSNNK